MDGAETGAVPGDTPPRSRREWWLARLHSLTWITAGVLVAVVAVWALRLGEGTQLSWATMAALHLALLAAWPVLVVALVRRQWALSAVAGLLIVAQVVIGWPMLPRPSDAADVSREGLVTLGSANVYVDNPDPARTARRIAEDPPDILVVQEYTPEARDAFDQAGLLDEYPHRVEHDEPGTTGLAVYSRFPLEQARPLRNQRDQLTVTATLPDETELTVVDVHAFGPQPGDGGRWYRALRTIDRDLDQTPEPWIAIGDYNATLGHRAFRDLLDGGNQDAHEATGRGAARSWPAGRLLPPLLLIDHAVVSPDVDVLATGERTLPGTDHRMITVTLAP